MYILDLCRLVAPEREDESKGLVAKLLPIWVTSLVFAAIYSQLYTLFTKQSSTLDRRLGGATGPVVPPAALQVFVSVTMIAVLPVYDRVLVPLVRRFTRHHAAITPFQRIGAGMAMSGVIMVVARGRRAAPRGEGRGPGGPAGRVAADEPVVGGASVRHDRCLDRAR